MEHKPVIFIPGQSILQLQCTHFFNRLQDMPFGGIWCCYIWYGTVLRSQQSMIIHEHDENSWQRLFTVRSLPDAHHPVHGTLGNQDIYDSWNCQLFFEAHKKEFLYKLIIVFVSWVRLHGPVIQANGRLTFEDDFECLQIKY